jgi:recombination protein RecA
MTKASDLLREINSALGGNVLYMASSAPRLTKVPTGILPFDFALEGGFPRGRMCEIYGAPSALKSYVGLCAIREAQRAGGLGALLDTERTFDPEWAESIGVDLSKLILWPPPDNTEPISGEMALDAAEAILRSNQVDMLVFDSVAAALPQDLLTKRMSGETVQPGRLAAMMSIGLRKLTSANTNTAMLWVNQLRTNIGITFGNPENPAGGKALAYYATLRINVKAIGKVSATKKVHDGEKYIDIKNTLAQKFKITIDKSKIFAPGKETVFTWLYSQAQVDELGFLVSQGLERGLITQQGAMWQIGDLKVRGREKFLIELPQHPDVLAELETDVMSRLGIGSG